MGGLKNIANELGKTFFNIAVAILVFVLLQPFVKGELTKFLVGTAFIGISFSLLIGSILLYFGGSKDDS